MREQKLGSRTIGVAYDSAKNRVASNTDTAGSSRTFAYDARGNATGAGALTFAYDFANQPTSVSGGASATYAYDANLKRVKSVAGGATTYSFYSRRAGGLIYTKNTTDAAKNTDYFRARSSASSRANSLS